MGYNSALEIHTWVKEEFIKDAKGLFAEIKIRTSIDMAEDWEYELENLEIEDDGTFECSDWYGKWYNVEKWIAKLAPFLEDGDIELIGENGARWGYRIKRGVAHDIVYITKIGHPLNIDWMKEEKEKRNKNEAKTII